MTKREMTNEEAILAMILAPPSIYVVQRHDPNSSDNCEAVAAYGSREDAVDGIELIAREELSYFDQEFDKDDNRVDLVKTCLAEGSKFSDYLLNTADVWFDIVAVPCHVEDIVLKK